MTSRRDRYQRLRAAALSALGGKCQRCGLDDPRALNIDHVYGDGYEERKHMRGEAFLRYVIAHVDSGRYMALCASCNQIKRITNFENGKRFNLDVVTDLETFFYSPDQPE